MATPSVEDKRPLIRIDPLRLLIVDDNRDEADSLAILLGYRGYHIDVAYSSSEALELASRCRPEVLLLDLGLPGMSGYELATELQQKLDHPVLIATTGFADDAYRRKGQEVGFEYHFVKPVSVARLRQVLESVFKSRRPKGFGAAEHQ
ncbi:MAG TPA: response regulator [Pirellulales bacterium]|jgi:CheY-like chemotaxis protein|nr:response regulator [Pirellulales bacterium]